METEFQSSASEFVTAPFHDSNLERYDGALTPTAEREFRIAQSIASGGQRRGCRARMKLCTPPGLASLGYPPRKAGMARRAALIPATGL